MSYDDPREQRRREQEDQAAEQEIARREYDRDHPAEIDDDYRDDARYDGSVGPWETP